MVLNEELAPPQGGTQQDCYPVCQLIAPYSTNDTSGSAPKACMSVPGLMAVEHASTCQV